MPRLPQPGQDSGQWGDLLNEYLRQTHTESGTLKDNIVTANTIANGAITEANLAPAVTTKLNDTSTTVTDNSVTTAKLVDSSITTAKIAPNAITNTQIADGSVSEAKLSSAVVTKLNATGSSTPADGSITTTKLADNSVTSAKIVDGTIAETDLAAAVVTKLNAAGTSTPADGSITTAKLADVNVTTAKLADANVTTAKLADNSVTSAKIVDGTIAETDLAAAVVTKLNAAGSSTPADGSITTAKLADANVTTAKLADNSVTSAKIVDGTIAETDLASAVVTKLNAISSGSTVAGTTVMNVQNTDGSWPNNATTINQLHTNGYKIMWFTRAGGALPTTTDGLADGDTVNGLTVQGGTPVKYPLTIPAGSYPTATDVDGTANDKVVLTKVANVIWRVGPTTTYDEASFSGGTTQSVAYTGGDTVTVTALPASTSYTISGTSSWNLTFTNISTVTLTAGQSPTAQDPAGTASDTVTLTKVTGVIWTVNSVDYPSSAMAGSTQTVNYTGGNATTVTARADTGYALNGTNSWDLTFTNATNSEVIYFQSDFNTADATFTTGQNIYKTSGTVEYKTGGPGPASIIGNVLSLPVSDTTVYYSGTAYDSTDIQVEFKLIAPGDVFKRTGVRFLTSAGDKGFTVAFNGSMLLLRTASSYTFNDQAGAAINSVTFAANDVLGIRYVRATNTVMVYKNGALAAQDVLNISSYTGTSATLYHTQYAAGPFRIDDLKVFKPAS